MPEPRSPWDLLPSAIAHLPAASIFDQHDGPIFPGLASASREEYRAVLEQQGVQALMALRSAMLEQIQEQEKRVQGHLAERHYWLYLAGEVQYLMTPWAAAGQDPPISEAIPESEIVAHAASARLWHIEAEDDEEDARRLWVMELPEEDPCAREAKRWQEDWGLMRRLDRGRLILYERPPCRYAGGFDLLLVLEPHETVGAAHRKAQETLAQCTQAYEQHQRAFLLLGTRLAVLENVLWQYQLLGRNVPPEAGEGAPTRDERPQRPSTGANFLLHLRAVRAVCEDASVLVRARTNADLYRLAAEKSGIRSNGEADNTIRRSLKKHFPQHFGQDPPGTPLEWQRFFVEGPGAETEDFPLVSTFPER